jgi:glycine/D-amino acid oxidase-like deaminating enzyme
LNYRTRSPAAHPLATRAGCITAPYHAVSIKDRTQAIQVARRCIYGHEEIRRFAPEAVELDGPGYVLVKDPSKVVEAMSRWKEAGVRCRRVSRHAFRRIEPRVNTADVAAVFAAGDVSINSRMVYAKALARAQWGGAQVFTRATFSDIRRNEATLLVNGRPQARLSARLFVYTAGFGIRRYFRDQFSVDLPMRFWKSHLLVLRRVARHGVFCLDPGEAAMMHHGQSSIVGLNEDAQLVAEPTYEPVPENAAQVRQALRRLIPHVDLSDCLEVACIKVDTPAAGSGDRSLNVACGEPLPGHFWVLPGKMTEAPFVTDVTTHIIFERLQGHGELVALRPCDQWAVAERKGGRERRSARPSSLTVAEV